MTYMRKPKLPLEPRRQTDPGPKGVLARIYRQIYYHLVKDINMNKLMEQYINRNYSHSTVKGSKAQNKSNLIDEFNRETMTWAVFCKVLRFFKFTRVDIVFRCYDSKGRFHDFTHNMNLTNPHEDKNDEDDIVQQPKGANDESIG